MMDFMNSMGSKHSVSQLLSTKHFFQQNLFQSFSHMQNAEIFTLTYGSLVRQLLSDLEDPEAVNKQLATM